MDSVRPAIPDGKSFKREIYIKLPKVCFRELEVERRKWDALSEEWRSRTTFLQRG
jgi:hypothetical protein